MGIASTINISVMKAAPFKVDSIKAINVSVYRTDDKNGAAVPCVII